MERLVGDTGDGIDVSQRRDEFSQPLVSIIIPCYRQVQYLPEAIEGAQGQTHQNVEIVVVDDGSPDDTAQVAARYGVACVRQDNRGIAEARNAGFYASHGQFVLFLDADDRLTSTAVEKHLECFKAHPEAGFVVGDIDQIGPDGSYRESPRWPVLAGEHYRELLCVNHVANTIAVMMRREVVEKLGGFDRTYTPAEDYEFLLRAARNFRSAHHRNVVAQYRRHGGNTSRRGVVMLRAMNRVLREQAKLIGSDPELREAMRRGDIYWREHFGRVAMVETYRLLRAGQIWRALQHGFVLSCYVRERIPLLPWKNRRLILRTLRGVRPGAARDRRSEQPAR